MRSSRLAFAMILCGALMPGQGSGAQEERHGVSAVDNRPSSHLGPTNPNGPRQPTNNVRRPTSGNSAIHHSGLPNSAGSAASGAISSQGVRHVSSVPTSSAAGAHPVSLSTVRHRTPNPAIVGGMASTSAKGLAISGTQMSRKP
jgi:hypothetical protein